MRRAFDTWSPPLSGLEADVLQNVGRPAIELRRRSVVSPPRGQIALGDPGLSAVTARGHLVVGALSCAERLFGFVEPILLQQRAPENELRIADLVQFVDSIAEQLQRVASLLLRPRDVPAAEVHLGDAVDRVR